MLEHVRPPLAHPSSAPLYQCLRTLGAEEPEGHWRDELRGVDGAPIGDAQRAPHERVDDGHVFREDLGEDSMPVTPLGMLCASAISGTQWHSVALSDT